VTDCERTPRSASHAYCDYMCENFDRELARLQDLYETAAEGIRASAPASLAYELSTLRERSAARATVTGWLRRVATRPVRVLGSRATPSWMNKVRRS
jgi:hypothetical protein